MVSLGPGDNIKESLWLYARSLTFVKLDIDGDGAGRWRPVFSLEVPPRVTYPEPCMRKSWRWNLPRDVGVGNSAVATVRTGDTGPVNGVMIDDAIGSGRLQTGPEVSVSMMQMQTMV